jgi:hypothetical protein
MSHSRRVARIFGSRHLMLQIIAHHEASHAAAYLAFDYPFRFVAIDETSGVVRSVAGRQGCLARAVICLAGPAGESLYTGIPISDLLQDDNVGGTDYQMAIDALSRLSPCGRITTAILGARHLVNRNWSAIQRLASVLLDERHLSYQQVRALCQS